MSSRSPKNILSGFLAAWQPCLNPSPGACVCITIDITAPGNLGLVNKEKFRLCCESAILFHFLQNLIDENFKPFRFPPKEG